MSTLTRNSPTRNHAARDLLTRDPAGPGALARERDLPHTPDPYITRAASEERSRLYRGRTVDELIPRIVSELGEDAIVLRHHTGLSGGFAGFFQKPFVEIEACRGSDGGQLLDRYDEDDAAPALPGELEEYHAPFATDDWDEPRGVARTHISPSHGAPVETDHWEEPREVWATNPFAEALAEAEAAVRAAEPTVPPDLDAALAAALAEAEAAGLPPEPTIHPDLPETLTHGVSPLEAPSLEAPSLEAPSLEAPPLDALPAEISPTKASLGAAEPLDELPPLAPPASVAPPVAPRSPTHESTHAEIERALLDVGITAEFVHELIEGTTAHVLPLMPSSMSLTEAVHTALAQRMPTCPPLPAAGGAIAVVGAGGSGKSACCAALWEAYCEHSTLPAACAAIVSEPTHPTGAEGELLVDLRLLDPRSPEPLPLADPGAAAALREAREGGLLLLDTPPVSCADPASIGALAAQLALLEPDRVVLALPATLGARPAGQLLEALRPLGASALVITHADATDQLGVAIQAACTFGLAPTYLLEGGGSKARLTQIDPSELVARLLPHR